MTPVKLLFQNLCSLKLSWDDKMPMNLYKSYQKWINDIQQMSDIKIPRAYNPNFTQYKRVELHYFSDGSKVAFAAVAYIKYIGENNEVNCSLLMSKTRLVPLSKSMITTIPRIELNAAKLAVTLQQTIKKELDIKVDEEYFWIDSEIVLHYINNETKRFKRFVHNRISYIRTHTNVESWNYVNTKNNIADVASRGMKVKEFIDKKEWFSAPQFLYENMDSIPKFNKGLKVDTNDEEVSKEKVVMSTKIDEKAPINKIFESTSDWLQIKIKIA
jgi:hypothetical protein